MTRGEVFELRAPRRPRGHEQQGPRYGVVVQADELLHLSTVVVAPTSTQARAASWRPRIEVAGEPTRVLVEQLRATDYSRLGDSQGHLSVDELVALDEALELMLDLRRI
jgi:mRNA interferase MazF